MAKQEKSKTYKCRYRFISYLKFIQYAVYLRHNHFLVFFFLVTLKGLYKLSHKSEPKSNKINLYQTKYQNGG